MVTMPARAASLNMLEQQLLVQLGQRLRRARKDRNVSSVELAKQVGISRTTLRAVELGDPSPTLGTYLRVLTALGVAGDLALLAAGVQPVVQTPATHNSLDLHGAQDLQSLLMHREAVRLLHDDPSLVTRVEQTLARWMQRDDPNSLPLLKRWARIVTERDWSAAVAETEEAQQLRQSSPLSTILPQERRLAIIREAKLLKERAVQAACTRAFDSRRGANHR